MHSNYVQEVPLAQLDHFLPDTRYTRRQNYSSQTDAKYTRVPTNSRGALSTLSLSAKQYTCNTIICKRCLWHNSITSSRTHSIHECRIILEVPVAQLDHSQPNVEDAKKTNS